MRIVNIIDSPMVLNLSSSKTFYFGNIFFEIKSEFSKLKDFRFDIYSSFDILIELFQIKVIFID